MSGIKIFYDTSPLGLRESLEADSNVAENNLSDAENLVRQPIRDKTFGNPCEEYSVILDGETSAIPNKESEAWFNFGFFGEQKTDENGVFPAEERVFLRSSKTISIEGLTIHFDEANEIYPTEIIVDFLNSEEVISSNYLYPDSPVLFIPTNFSFDEVVISPKKMNMPDKRFYISYIDFGRIEEITGRELRNSVITDEIDDIGGEMPIGVFDFTFENKNNHQFSFEKKHPITVYYDGDIKFSGYISNVKNKAKDIWNLSAENNIGLLESAKFYGGMYENAPLEDVIKSISDASGAVILVDDLYSQETISGHLPISSCREALNKIAFILGAEVNASGSSIISVSPPKEEVSQTVSQNRQMMEPSEEEKSEISSVRVALYSYAIGNEEQVVFETNYRNDIGKEFFVEHPSPVYDVFSDSCDIIESNANFTRFVVRSVPCQLIAIPYIETKIVKEKIISGSIGEGSASVEDVKIVTRDNVDIVLQRCYYYYKDESYIESKIIEGKKEHFDNPTTYGKAMFGKVKYGDDQTFEIVIKDEPVKLGDIIELESKGDENKVCRVIRQKYNLNGGILAKDTKLRFIKNVKR